jgi:hypothetical protein
MTSLRESLDHVRGGDYDDQTVVWSRAAKCFLKCENFRFLGLGCDLIFDLTFGQYKRNIKRGQANIDLQAIGSDTLNSRIRIFEIFKKFFDSGSTSLRKMVVR